MTMPRSRFGAPTDLFPVEPWVISATRSTPASAYVHALELRYPTTWCGSRTGAGVRRRFLVAGVRNFHQRIVCVAQHGVLRDDGCLDSMGLFTTTPTAAGAQSYYISATPRTGSADEIEERLAFQEKLADDLLVDDIRAFTGMRFDEGAFVGADRHLVRWFRHARTYPQRDLAATFAKR